MDDQVFTLLNGRLDKQDRVLDQILTQAKLTNGKVIDHEHRLEHLEESRRTRRRERWTRLEISFGLCAALLCGTAGEVLRALIIGHF